MGIPHARLHYLRCTFATTQLRAGTHPLVVSEALGHARASITPDLYPRIVPRLGKEAAQHMEDLPHA